MTYKMQSLDRLLLRYEEQNAFEMMTSSSAIAERSRDASCLSVVSFSSTIHRASSFITSYFGFTFTNAILLFSSAYKRCGAFAVINKVR